jgi:hypothetical protein
MAAIHWRSVYTRVRFTAWELRQMTDALQHVMDNPDPAVDYSALGSALDKIRTRIRNLNWSRLGGEEPL